MPGTLVISDLSDGTNSTSATNCIQGSAKAWINFNGTGTPAIRASYNVSSITDNGTGNYTINFTNALADANYAVAGMGNVITIMTNGRNTNGADGGNNTSTACTVKTFSTAQAAIDVFDAYVAVFR
jgi:hypothetical protein